jgi:hypothetical protein
MAEISIELATPADDPELRRILRGNPMPGAISVSFEREPSYFIGARVEAPSHQTIVVRDQDRGEIVGMGTRSIRDLYVNGTPQAVGYLSQFRADPRYRAMRKTLTRAFSFLYRLHQDGRVPFYLSSIIEDNLPARRVFTAGLPGLPRYQEYSRLHTLAIYCRRKRRRLPMPDGLQLERGSSPRINEIVACLQRNCARYQFAPYWAADSLFCPDGTPGLTPDDFFLALDGEQVVGCLAAWDQSLFKQTVVRSYSGTLARWRGLANVAARLVGWPALPPPNAPFRYCHASHLAVDDDRPDVMAALVRAVYNHTVGKKYSYFMLGFCENHSFFETVISTYPHIDYTSQLYLVAWEQELDALSQVDDRLPGVEIAVL